MNFLTMDYFIMVEKERSFTKAAERLHITQQTLSAHIAGLEQELGCQLFIRHVPLELTYAGEIFHRYAVDFHRKHSSMKREFADLAKNEKGVLRIGIATTRGRVIMPALIEQFHRYYPQIEIQIKEEVNDMLLQSLVDREADLSIANFSEMLPGVQIEDFYQEEIVLLIAQTLLEQTEVGGQQARTLLQNGDLSPLRASPFLLNGLQDIAGRIGRNCLERADIIPIVKATSSNLETLLDLCLRGVGACFCPRNLAETILTPQQKESLEIFHLGMEAHYMIRFAYLKQAYQWNIISAFIALSRRFLDKAP